MKKKITINGQYAGFTTEENSELKFVCREEKCNHQITAIGGGEYACEANHANKVEVK